MTTSAPIHPSLTAAWRSLSSARAALGAELDEALAREELPPASWYDLLDALAASEVASLRPRDLGCHVALTKSGLTRLADRMVDAGVIERLTCERDRRGTYLHLTAAGRELHARMRPVYESVVARTLGASLGRDEAEELVALLDRARPAPPAGES